MSVEIQWDDTDPESGAKRFVRVSRFAGRWSFQLRYRRRENWVTPTVITRDMWETLLEALERRAKRREGVTEADVKAVRKTLEAMAPPPESEDELGTIGGPANPG